MVNARHWFVIDLPVLPPDASAALIDAQRMEVSGNWFLAGEIYLGIFRQVEATASPFAKAKLLARGASCFEISQDKRLTARMYEKAAREIQTLSDNPGLAAQLFNRAALHFSDSGEFFTAGVAWDCAAEELRKIDSPVITPSESYPPFPGSAFKWAAIGSCFEAAALVYLKAVGNEMWGAGTFLRAGNAYNEGMPNIHAFNAYRRSLVSNIRYYKILKLEKLRNQIPLSQQEHDSKIDPIAVMEASLLRCNSHHQTVPGVSINSQIQTHKQMSEVFHEFSQEFLAIGNNAESSYFRSQKNQRQLMIYKLERRRFSSLIFYLWKISSDFGESLNRWALTCAFVIFSFAMMYMVFEVVSSTVTNASKLHISDYLYFSIITFSTLGYGDLHPVGVFGQILSCTEVIFGFIMFGVLLSFVGNRLQRS